MWHVSVSIWNPKTEKKMVMPRLAEKEAVQLLAGVGGETEWWIAGANGTIGHLRAPVTETEYDLCPAGVVVDDAGESGPLRPRTQARGIKQTNIS